MSATGARGAGVVAAALVMAVGLAACGGAADSDSRGAGESEMRDSAGVRIVENRVPGGATALSVAEPRIRIGQLDGPPEYQMHRVQAVTRLSHGGIVVADAGSSEIRVYDAAGAHVRTAGGAGDGPGEFRSITYMRRLVGDSLFIYDGRHRRITILAPDGSHVRDYQPAGGDPRASVVAALEDGTLLLTRGANTPDPSSTSVFRDSAIVEVERNASGDSAAALVLGQYAGGDRQFHITESGGQIASIEISMLPFSRSRYTTASRDRFIIGTSHSWELHVYDGAGALDKVVRRPDVPTRPVTDEIVAAEIERRLAVQAERAASGGTTPDLADVRRRLESQPRVETLPAFAAVVPVDGGGAWVKEYVPPAEESAVARWTVLDMDGVVRAQVEMPAAFRPLHVDDGVVIGVERDEFDVEYVVAYATPSD